MAAHSEGSGTGLSSLKEIDAMGLPESKYSRQLAPPSDEREKVRNEKPPAVMYEVPGDTRAK